MRIFIFSSKNKYINNKHGRIGVFEFLGLLTNFLVAIISRVYNSENISQYLLKRHYRIRLTILSNIIFDLNFLWKETNFVIFYCNYLNKMIQVKKLKTKQFPLFAFFDLK